MRVCAERGCRSGAEVGPHCERHAMSAAALADQLKRANGRVGTLGRELAACRALLRTSQVGRDDWDILDRVAGVLITAAAASGALTSSGGFDPTGRSPKVRRRNDQPTPGAAQGAARASRRRLIAALVAACEAFDSEMENGWRRPDDGVPRVSCYRQDCASRNLKVRAWRTIRGGRRVYAERCQSCGGPLARHDEDGGMSA